MILQKQRNVVWLPQGRSTFFFAIGKQKNDI